MSPAYKKLLKASRVAHVYLTLFGLAVILFFAVTGFMLNHESWFLPKLKDRALPERTGRLPKELIDKRDRGAIVEALRRDHGVGGFLGGCPMQLDRDDADEASDGPPRPVPRAHDMDFLFPWPAADDPDAKVVLKFVAPSKEFDVTVWVRDEPAPEGGDGEPRKAARRAGDVQIGATYKGWGGLVMDLHKGKASGRAWAWVIDVTCGLLLVISATGLVLWSSLRTRGKWGAVLLLLGGLAAAGVYLLGVPR